MHSILKQNLILAADLLSIFISLLVMIELENGLNFNSITEKKSFFLIICAFYIIFWFVVKENRNVYRYFSSKTLIEIFVRCFFSISIGSYFANQYIIDLNLLKQTSFLSIVSIFIIFIYRQLIKYLFKVIFKKDILRSDANEKINIIIYGAGDAGIKLNESLKSDNLYKVIAFVDDNKSIIGRLINKTGVYKQSQIEFLKEKFNVRGVIFAMPSVDEKILKKYCRLCLDLNLFVAKVPSINNLIHGQNKINEFKLFDINDLLSRNEVNHFTNKKNINLKKLVIAITGGAGSIGSELCKQLLELNVEKIIIIENHEYSLFKLQKFLETRYNKNIFKCYLADIKDKKYIESIFLTHKVDMVYHAAAYKHVEMLQTNILSAINSNVLGTFYTLDAAKSANVKKFILISTDKAVNPTNIMGATKRLAEIIVSANSKKLLKNNKLTTSIVRFGNVLGSKGSVIPILMKQIEKGGPVTVTDPKAIRYFMTIKEAAQLVILASSISEQHRTYILEMGKQKNILKLAKELILLNGLIPIQGNYKKPGKMNIIFTGLKNGEKLKEKLFISDNVSNTKLDKIKFIDEPTLEGDYIENFIQEMINDFKNQKIEKLIHNLKQITGLRV